MDSFAHYIVDILTVIASVGGAYYAVRLRYKSQNKLDSASADNAISEAWQRLNKPLVERIEKLEADIEERDAMIEDLRDWIERLINQIKKMGAIPVKFIPKKSNLSEV